MKVKLKRRPKELPRKARVLCDFCRVSTTRRDEQRPHLQEHEALDKIKLEKAERLPQQKKEAGDENEGTRRRVLVPCRSGERREKQDGEAPPVSRSQIEYERRKAESMHSEFERLWLLEEGE